MSTAGALLTLLWVTVAGSPEPTLAIDVRVPNWTDDGMVDVDLRNMGSDSICVSERLTDHRSVQVYRQGQQLEGNPRHPFIGFSGPSCRMLLPGEIVRIRIDASNWQPDRRSRDRVCYGKNYRSSEGVFEEVTSCADAR